MNLLIVSLCGFLLLSYASGRDNSLCPQPEDIYPCFCSKICPKCDAKIVCSNIVNNQELQEVWSRSDDFPFPLFELSNSTILYFPANLLEIKKIRELSIVNTTMISLFDEPPPATNLIQVLTLNNVKLQRGIVWELLSNFTNMHTLSVTNTYVGKILNTFGRHITKRVSIIQFHDTKTQSIGDHAFAPLENIESIVVEKSSIKILKRSMFPTPFVAERLCFDNNLIASLPDGLFADMPKLTVVEFRNNRLTTFSESVFGNLQSSFNGIYVEGNPIICNCKLQWLPGKKMTYIEGICAGRNLNAGKKLRDLKELDFSYC